MRTSTPLELWSVGATAGPGLSHVTAPVPLRAPGGVHGALLDAGAIPDPFVGENEAALSWIGRTAWRFETTLSRNGIVARPPRPGERVELVFHGIDTVAAISVDRNILARVENMFRCHRVDVTDVIGTGEGRVAIEVEAPVDAALQREAHLGRRHRNYPHPYNALRTMACSFGWDWGPDVAGAALWRPVHLVRWHTARLGEVRPLVVKVEAEHGAARSAPVRADLEVAVPVIRAGGGDGALSVEVRVNGVATRVAVPPGESEGPTELRIPVRLDGVHRWWPRGYGDQPLYEVDVQLRHGGDVLDRSTTRIGIRCVRVDHTPDAIGTGFSLVVNDVPVLVKGFNWIPDDALIARMTRTRYKQAVDHAVEAGANLLRVWGGGVYESQAFYEICDETGMLVWQDFPFGCAAYAEEEPLWSEVEAEARENVARLSGHPSLVVWNGNNENLWGYHEWEWPEMAAGLTWGDGYYHELLPRVLAELDPTRPYLDGSPSSYGRDDARPNAPEHGTMHVWDVWNERDAEHYRTHAPRFAAEYGYQGPPAWATLTRAVHDDPLTPDSPGMRAHQKAHDGMEKLTRGARPHVPFPTEVTSVDELRDWHWAMQLQQARAVRLGTEHFRSLYPHCTGTIVWQLNDCWPVISWAAVDSAGIRKPLWHALRASYAPVLVSVQPRGGGLAVVIGNDTDHALNRQLTLTRMSFTGEVLSSTRVAVRADARAAVEVSVPSGLAEPLNPRAELLLAELDPGRRGLWFFAEDVEAQLDPRPLSATVLEVATTASGREVTVDVHAHALAKDVTMLPDVLDPAARVDTGLVTLLPGESHRFVVTLAVDAAAAKALTTWPVLRSANDLRRYTTSMVG